MKLNLFERFVTFPLPLMGPLSVFLVILSRVQSSPLLISLISKFLRPYQSRMVKLFSSSYFSTASLAFFFSFDTLFSFVPDVFSTCFQYIVLIEAVWYIYHQWR